MTIPKEVLTVLPRSGEVVVFDLEWTAWEGSLARNWSGPGEYREIIQIGAAMLDVVEFKLLSVFDRLVLPIRNPILSDYITKLTGITNERIHSEGTSLNLALKEFEVFMGGRSLWCNGGDAAVLRDNCAFQTLEFTFVAGSIGNLRPLLALVTGLPASRLVSCELPEVLGIGSSRNCHSGVSDALAIAQALSVLRKRGKL